MCVGGGGGGGGGRITWGLGQKYLADEPFLSGTAAPCRPTLHPRDSLIACGRVAVGVAFNHFRYCRRGHGPAVRRVCRICGVHVDSLSF